MPIVFKHAVCALPLIAALAAGGGARGQTTQTLHVEAKLADGAAYLIDKPADWNGVLLLWSHGYSPTLGAPEDAFNGDKTWLLKHGYALAGSAYSAPGWALSESVPDQIGVLDAFAVRFGKPKQTIAWGSSMGGLVTAALAERYADRFDGALPMCGSVAGAVGMMNEALDGAFAFRTLAAPTSDIRLVHVGDDRANGAKVAAAVTLAQATPQGRARLALAGVLGGLPGWTDPSMPEPGANDFEAQEAQMAKIFAMGVFLPRADQERRAGGVFSWNTGVDYQALLLRSGRRPIVEMLYRKAGLSLDADLKALNAAPRIAADPTAVAYMSANFSPTGALKIPALTVHTVGDGLTSVTGERAYAEAAGNAGAGAMLGQTFVQGAGHCRFQPSETLAALQALQQRIKTGAWSIAPEQLNSLAAATGLGAARFISFEPKPFLRSWTPQLHAALYPDKVMTSQYVAMRDGVRLAVDIYRPSRGGVVQAAPAPVLVLHSLGLRPHGGEPALSTYGVDDLVAHGYNVVWIEARGVGASFGHSGGFLTQENGRDAADVVEWAAAQPWSNGKVGMFGISNMGYIQWLAAAQKPPHLMAIAPAVANPNLYYQLYPNGVSALGGAPGVKTGPSAARAERLPEPAAMPVDEDAGAGHPLLTLAKADHAANLTLPDEWLPNMYRDQLSPKVGYAPGLKDAVLPYYADLVQSQHLQVLQLGGWFDASAGGQLAAQRSFGGHIIIGAWPHMLLAEGGPVLRPALVQFFDHVLKGVDNGYDEAPKVRYQTINAADDDAWRSASGWPLAIQKSTSFYLSGEPGVGALSKIAPRNGTDAYTVNPEITAFDGHFNRLKRVWDGDMTKGVDDKGLTYTTAPLDADLEVTGQPIGDLWITADAPDVDLICYLEAVTPDGRSHFVTDGVIRASHRKLDAVEPWAGIGVPFHRSFKADARPLHNSEPAELKFDFNPTSYLFKAGVRLRLTVTGGERNTYQEPVSFDPADPPRVMLLKGGARPSRLILPIITP